MCTRYFVDLSPELRPYIEAADNTTLREKMVRILGKPFKAEGEVRPSDMAAVIAPSARGIKTAFPMVWGFHISGVERPVVNARVETAKEKPSFAESWYRHRCVIPASYYFEWTHIIRPDGTKKPGDKYAIQPKGATVTWLAGLYRIEESRELKYPVFTVLTREPSEELRKIHDRMPLILPGETVDAWISPTSDPDRVVEKALTDMVAEKAE